MQTFSPMNSGFNIFFSMYFHFMCLELDFIKLSQVDRSAVPVPIWRVHPLRAARLLALRHQTGFDFSEKCRNIPIVAFRRRTPSPAERGLLASPSCTWAGTSTLATSWWCLALFIPINFCVYFPIQLCSILMFAFQYQSDPSGNYGGWKATCIGNNWNAAVSMLKQEYKVLWLLD